MDSGVGDTQRPFFTPKDTKEQKPRLPLLYRALLSCTCSFRELVPYCFFYPLPATHSLRTVHAGSVNINEGISIATGTNFN